MPQRGERKVDIVGARFGRLVCLSDGAVGASRKAVFRCDCGAVKEIIRNNVVSGKSLSCGCLGRDRSIARSTTHGHTSGGRTPTYWSWISMVRRCSDKGATNFSYYGGRGISVCDRWRDSFEAFLADMGPRPSKSHTIDRYPDNEGNYEPGNCRWATKKQQSVNRRPRRPAEELELRRVRRMV